MVKYVYDAWGNQKIVDCNGNEVVGTNHIGKLNPFRYRSYYYDMETNLYFLKTRYYDPEICRFITIDDISYLAPDTINGLNLYAYCKNNPVMYLDETGCFAEGLLFQFAVSALCYVGFSIAAIWDKDVKSDMDKLGKLFGDSKNEFLSSIPNIFNNKEDIVVASQKVSFYKGVPVLRLNPPSSFSFGVMVLDNAGTGTADNTTVKHEYGHNVQQMIIGPEKYLFGIGIPSVCGAILLYGIYEITSMNYETYKKIYYSLPWERSADLFGGASHPAYYHNSEKISLVYLLSLLFLI